VKIMNHEQVNICMTIRSNFKILTQNLPVTSQLLLDTSKTLLQFRTFVSEYGLLCYTYSFCANGRNNGWETRKIFSFYVHWLSSMKPEIYH